MTSDDTPNGKRPIRFTHAFNISERLRAVEPVRHRLAVEQLNRRLAELADALATLTAQAPAAETAPRPAEPATLAPEADTVVDGPREPLAFRWNGKDHRPSPQVHAILSIMWERESASYAEFVAKVFPDNVIGEAPPIRQAIVRVNSFLETANCNRRLESYQGQVVRWGE